MVLCKNSSTAFAFVSLSALTFPGWLQRLASGHGRSRTACQGSFNQEWLRKPHTPSKCSRIFFFQKSTSSGSGRPFGPSNPEVFRANIGKVVCLAASLGSKLSFDAMQAELHGLMLQISMDLEDQFQRRKIFAEGFLGFFP